MGTSKQEIVCCLFKQQWLKVSQEPGFLLMDSSLCFEVPSPAGNSHKPLGQEHFFPEIFDISAFVQVSYLCVGSALWLIFLGRRWPASVKLDYWMREKSIFPGKILGDLKYCLEINTHHQVGKWNYFASLLCEHGNSPPYPDGSRGNAEQNRFSFWDQGPTQVSRFFPVLGALMWVYLFLLLFMHSWEATGEMSGLQTSSTLVLCSSDYWRHMLGVPVDHPAQDTLPIPFLIPGIKAIHVWPEIKHTLVADPQSETDAASSFLGCLVKASKKHFHGGKSQLLGSPPAAVTSIFV